MIADHGLGTAYERHVFYQRLDAWARQLGVTSMLEGPVDGMRGVSGVHGAVLARRGVKVTSVVGSEEDRAAAERVYAKSGGAENAIVRVLADTKDVTSLPKADCVVAYDALAAVGDWRAYLASIGALATRALVITVKNEASAGRALSRFARRERAGTIRDEDLDRELRAIGRVRDDVYFDAPWWPDVRASRARAFVYDGDRWPYFGGEGWDDELFPALQRHPTFDGRGARLAKWMAHMRAIVVEKIDPATKTKRRLEVR